MNSLNCLITGASSGIGKSISIELSKISKHVYITSRDVKKLEEVHDIIINNDCECTIVPLDLLEENSIENLANNIASKEKAIDILVLSAGKIDHLSPVDSIDLKKLNEITSLNFIANFRIIKNFHYLLKKSKNPHLAVISSLKNEYMSQYWGLYQPIMSALNEMVLSYAHENKKNINANLYCPSAVDTDFRDMIMPGEDKSKIFSPDKVANIIVKYFERENFTGNLIKI